MKTLGLRFRSHHGYFYLTVIILFFATIALADEASLGKSWKSSPEAQFGFTSNANYVSTSPSSDYFLKISDLNMWKPGSWHYGFRLGYVKYFSQTANNALFWGIPLYWTGDLKGDSFITLGGRLFGYHYINTPPGNTDTDFTNLGFRIFAEHHLEINRTSSIVYGPGYEFRSYPVLSRFDNQFYLRGSYENDSIKDWSLEPYLEFGVIPSSEPVYTRSYYELGVYADFDLDSKSKLENVFYLRGTNYPNRTGVAQIIPGRNRNNTATTVISSDKDNLIHIGSEYVYNFSPRLQASGGISYENQTSISGNDDYSVWQMALTGKYKF